VDHRFNRAGYNAILVAEKFANRLQNKLEIGEITDDWTNTVNEALQPAFTSAWIRDGELRSTPH